MMPRIRFYHDDESVSVVSPRATSKHIDWAIVEALQKENDELRLQLQAARRYQQTPPAPTPTEMDAGLQERAALRLQRFFRSLRRVIRLQSWARGLIVRKRPDVRLLSKLHKKKQKILALEAQMHSRPSKYMPHRIMSRTPSITSMVRRINHHQYLFTYRDVSRSHIDEEENILFKLLYKTNTIKYLLPQRGSFGEYNLLVDHKMFIAAKRCTLYYGAYKILATWYPTDILRAFQSSNTSVYVTSLIS